MSENLNSIVEQLTKMYPDPSKRPSRITNAIGVLKSQIEYDSEVLKFEALKLINAYRKAHGYKDCSWEYVSILDRKCWLAVARCSRELRSE